MPYFPLISYCCLKILLGTTCLGPDTISVFGLIDRLDLRNAVDVHYKKMLWGKIENTQENTFPLYFSEFFFVFLKCQEETVDDAGKL